MLEQWEPVIGLEIHVQLATRSKLFSTAPTAFGAAPNSQVTWLDAGLPGTLPVVNSEAVRMAAQFGLAINGSVAERSVFARKNYFYPDLPKGYQISQYELPIVSGGELAFHREDGETALLLLERAHLEEDAGKSIHEGLSGNTGIDLNRAGVPLLEVVTKPCLGSAGDAALALKRLHALVRHLGICDGNLEQGSFRCDANVSVRQRGDDGLYTRVEIKNINSFRFVQRAIEFEFERQVHRRVNGEAIVQETRLYDPDRDETRSMRGKEEAEDYRYFPDPDLLPVVLETSEIEEIRQGLPELPDAIRTRYEALGISPADAVVLADEPALVHFVDQTLDALMTPVEARQVSNWILVELQGALRKRELTLGQSPVTPEALAGLLTRLADGSISSKIAKKVFEALLNEEGESADAIIEARGLKQITDTSAIEAEVDAVVANNPDQVAQYRAGQTKVFNFFVGKVMAATRGKANPDLVRDLLQARLDNGG